MPERVWYQSLYWRIAIGFILGGTALRVTQAALFVGLAGQANATENSRSPAHFAIAVAANLGDALESDPQADIGKMLHDEFARSPYRLMVVMRDGRVFKNRNFS